MHEPVDGRGGGHRVFEDGLLLGQWQVGGDQHAATLVPFGQESRPVTVVCKCTWLPDQPIDAVPIVHAVLAAPAQPRHFLPFASPITRPMGMHDDEQGSAFLQS